MTRNGGPQIGACLILSDVCKSTAGLLDYLPQVFGTANIPLQCIHGEDFSSESVNFLVGLQCKRKALLFVKAKVERCPSTVRPVFLVLVFHLSKQQNRTRTTSSTVLGDPPHRTRTKKLPLEEL